MDLTAPPAALTVICEGRRSATRDELGLSYAVRPYPHKAIAARLRCSQPHGGVARQWFVQGEVLALLPLEGAEGHAVALVWSVPSQQADEWLAGDPAGRGMTVTLERVAASASWRQRTQPVLASSA